MALLLLAKKIVVWSTRAVQKGLVTEKMEENSVKFWPQLRWALQWYEERGSPRNWFEWSRRCAGCYLFARFLLLLGMLCLVVHSPDNRAVQGFAYLFSSLAVLEILLVNTAVAFVTRNPADPFRTVVLALFSFLQIAVGFGILYAALSEKFKFDIPQGTPARFDEISAIYYSLVTLVTLGYGDIHPKIDEPHAQPLVAIELLVGLYFLAILIAIFASWGNKTGIERNSEPGKTI